MDFAAVDVQRVKWGMLVKNKSKCLQKIRFQLPRSCMKLVVCPKFEGALELGLDEPQFPIEFMDFIDALIDSVPEDIKGDKTYYSPWRRLTAFDDVLVFDKEENVVKNPKEKRGFHTASLLVQLDGLWVSERSWGFRFRTVQIKLNDEFVKPLEDDPPVRIFIQGAPYRFVHDTD